MGDVIPLLIRGPGGVLELFAVSAAGAVRQDSQPAADTWSGWTPLGDTGEAVTGIAVAASADGGLDLCATLKDNTVAHCRQDDQGDPFSAWENLGRPSTGAIADPTLILDSDSHLNLILSRPDGEGLITLRQTADGRFVKGPAIPALPPN